MSTIRTLGPVGYNPTGEYDNSTQYERLDVVYYQGSSYVAKASTIGQLPTNTTYWDCIAVGYLVQNIYDSVADMKTDTTLKNGMYAQTVGYYSANDGGSSIYKIRTKNVSETANEMNLIALSDNSLIAELILKNEITPEMIGAHADNTTDDSAYLLQAFTLAKSNNIKLLLKGNYYINDTITLDGGAKNVCIEEKTGFLRIDGQITVHNFDLADISFNLYHGGSNNKDEYGIVFTNLYKCNLVLNAKEVYKTAFYIKSQGTNPYTASKFCTVSVKGTTNLRTLLHASPTSDLGVAFGSYIDIEDTLFTYPIRFQNVRDVNIVHYENFINDTTFTKNSLEFINAGVRCSLMCLGGKCKNLIYQDGGNFRTDYLLLLNEQTGASVSTDYLMTGVYVKGAAKFFADYISSSKCLYTVDAHEMTDQSLFTVNHTEIDNTSPKGRGIYLPDIFKTDLTLSYNSNLRFKDITPTAASEHISISNIHVYKMQDMIHINGYITIDENVAYNSVLFTLRDQDKASYLSYGYMRQAANIIKIAQVAQSGKDIKSLNPLTLTDGANIYIDMTYKTVGM